VQGKLDLVKSKEILQRYKPRASVLPASLDFTQCPYMWPYCLQPFFAAAQPVVFNATILNGMGVYGTLTGPPAWVAEDAGGALLDVLFEWSDVLWPWSGHLSLFIRVKDEAAEYEGPASGVVRFEVESPPARGKTVRGSLVSCVIDIVFTASCLRPLAFGLWGL
jgi:membrane-bound transcription factor site-1 protease